MSAPSRNGPCPCGSGTKYKKCCRPKDEAARIAAAPPAPQPVPRNRVVYHRGRPLLISGRDMPPGVLDHAVDFYEAKDRGDGPAAQMMRFVQPLLEGVGADEAQMEKALKLGSVFWNLALCESVQREELMVEVLKTMTNEQDVTMFRAMASDMVERHQAMFPAMHRT